MRAFLSWWAGSRGWQLVLVSPGVFSPTLVFAIAPSKNQSDEYGIVISDDTYMFPVEIKCKPF